jgi:hypothetical protein
VAVVVGADRRRQPRHGYRFHSSAGRRVEQILNQGGLCDVDVLDAQDFALVAGNPPPPWMADTVLYQIFPDRFARSDPPTHRPLRGRSPRPGTTRWIRSIRDAATSSTAETSTASWTGWTTSSIWV